LSTNSLKKQGSPVKLGRSLVGEFVITELFSDENPERTQIKNADIIFGNILYIFVC
jgi:hypothetical protein